MGNNKTVKDCIIACFSWFIRLFEAEGYETWVDRYDQNFIPSKELIEALFRAQDDHEKEYDN